MGASNVVNAYIENGKTFRLVNHDIGMISKMTSGLLARFPRVWCLVPGAFSDQTRRARQTWVRPETGDQGHHAELGCSAGLTRLLAGGKTFCRRVWLEWR